MKLENYFRRFGIRNGSGAESSGLPYRTVWSADADPEGVQHPGIPGNPGHLGAVRGAHGGDAV